MDIRAATNPTRVATPPDAPIILVDRWLDAPRALVFRMYADPVHLAQFWGPHGSTTVIEAFDFRPGGSWRLRIRFPAGGEVVMDNTYREIVEPERIVFSFPDSVHPVPGEVVSSIRFAEEAGGTRIVAEVRFGSLDARDKAAEMGFATPVAHSLERLDALLAAR